MNEQIMTIITITMVVIAVAIVAKVRTVFVVQEGFKGLLYRKGRFAELLPPGRQVCWGLGLAVTYCDVRKAILTVVGQEVLTADNAAVKLSLVLNYQVADPDKVMHETQHWVGDLHTAGQLAARTVIGGVTLETLLGQRTDASAKLLALVQPQAAKIGINVFAVEVRDVMLPAELKRAYADTLKAKQEGLAALERARGESAALRNLANAARLLEGNPALQNLRLLQSLADGRGVGHTLVMGVPGGFVPLKPGNPASPSASDNAT
jgi:regulator of protease activity HflC (stomatin/prohibitin superfamily)